MIRQLIVLLTFLFASGWPGMLAAQQTTAPSAKGAGKKATFQPTTSLPRQRGDLAFRSNKKESSRGTRKSNPAAELAKSKGQPTNSQPVSSNSSKPPSRLPSFQNAAAPFQNSSAPPIIHVEPSSRSSTYQDPEGPVRDSPSDIEIQTGEGSVENGESQGDEPTGDEEGEEEGEDEETFFRPQIHDLGALTWESYYTGEVFSKAHGGIGTSQATRYRGNLDLTFHLDFEKARLWSGGEVFVYFHQTALSEKTK